MTPSAFRNGGADAVLRYAIGTCSLGTILVAASDKGVAAILIGEEPDSSSAIYGIGSRARSSSAATRASERW